MIVTGKALGRGPQDACLETAAGLGMQDACLQGRWWDSFLCTAVCLHSVLHSLAAQKQITAALAVGLVFVLGGLFALRAAQPRRTKTRGGQTGRSTVWLRPSSPYKNTKPYGVDDPIRFGAGGGTRTHTVLLPTDFESVTSANSITPAAYALL